MEPNTKIQIAIVDDHILFAHAIRNLLVKNENYNVLIVARGAKEFMQQPEDKLRSIDVLLLDINMPEVNGFELAAWTTKNFSEINILTLSMLHDEDSIIKMLKAGAKGYLLKDCHPQELQNAIDTVHEIGFYSSEISSKALLKSLNEDKPKLSINEEKMLKLVCSEMTYKQIADVMCLSPKTIDGYRESLFNKLSVKSRVGLVIYSIKHNFFRLN